MFTSLKDLVKQRKAAAVSGAAKAKVAQLEQQVNTGSLKRREEFALPSTGGVLAGVILAAILAVVFKDTVVKTLQKL